MAEICDYEGSRYRTDFWEGQGRGYEDRVERLALGKLLPSRGRRLIEIGAGYGRLADLYRGYDEVLLLDYALSQLQQAREQLGGGRFRYVAADLYHMPLVDGCLDTAVMVRVMHHVQAPPAALREIARILAPQGTFILEYANKRNAKAILRYLLRRQVWTPFSLEPVEFVRLNFDFHPAYMEGELEAVGFSVEERLAVSTFRLPLLKRLLPDSLLAHLDGILQRPSARLRLAPSLFVRARIEKAPSTTVVGTAFCCPVCATAPLRPSDTALTCAGCGRRWAIQDGIYNFKEPLTA
jgi:SAM-dependent methyltransferase